MNNQKILKYKTNLNFHPHSQNQFSSFKTKKKHSNSLNKYSSAPSDIITQVPQNSQKTFFTRPISLTPSNRLQSSFKRMLLPPKEKKYENKKTLILDLDETLVHSSFMPFERSDIVLKVDFDDAIYNIFVLVRPEVDLFLSEMASYYEIVIFTASLSKYASPLVARLDTNSVCKYKLYREHCTFVNGLYIKDLRRINRELKDVIIVDNSPISYAFTIDNGIPIKSWFSDKNDRELPRLIPLLRFLAGVKDVREYIPQFVKEGNIEFAKANRIINDILSKEEKENNNLSNNENNEKGSEVEVNNYIEEKKSKKRRKKENSKDEHSPNLELISKKTNFRSFKLNNNNINKINNGSRDINITSKKAKIDFLLKSTNQKQLNQTPISSIYLSPSKIDISKNNNDFPIKLQDNKTSKYTNLLDDKYISPFPAIQNHKNPLSLSQRLKLNQNSSFKLKISNSFKYLNPPQNKSNTKLSVSKLIRSKSTGKFNNYYKKPQTPKIGYEINKAQFNLDDEVPKSTKNYRSINRIESARIGFKK